MKSSASKFVAELRRDPRFAGYVADLAGALEAMDFEGDEIPDAKALFSTLEWIMSQPDSIERRVKAVARLFELTGKVENFNMREFYALQ